MQVGVRMVEGWNKDGCRFVLGWLEVCVIGWLEIEIRMVVGWV